MSNATEAQAELSNEEILEEKDVIAEEKRVLGIDDKEFVAGLGLSGGGIRSAAFNLGLLQSLSVSGLLEKIHYLSTVSGGGYIGSAYSWFRACDQGKRPPFPFAVPETPQGDITRRRVDWMRGRGNYLAPTAGLNIWALLAALFRGIVVNLAVLLPTLMVVMIVLAYPVDLTATPKGTLAGYVLLSGGIAALVSVVWFLFYALLSSGTWSADERREAQMWSGRVLWLTLILLVLGSLPLADRLLAEWILTTSGSAVLGAAATVLGWFTRKKHNEGQGWRAAAIGIGLTLLSYLFLVYLYDLATRWRLLETWYAPTLPVCIGMLAFSILIGMTANINRVSMHRYYRDRLREAFMPACRDYASEQDCASLSAGTPDLFTLTQLGELVTKPYHIVNTTLSTNTSKNAKLAGRGGENFIFSPHFCGSPATQYRRTKTFADKQFSLASAFAISGAAVDPDNGVTRFGPLAFLMTLLNIRLGYWCTNPGKKQDQLSPPWWSCILREMFQVQLDEKQEHIHLSDGGHFENLAAYELIRRRCDVVIVGDAGADPGNTFDSLGNLVEIVRVDFGVEISIDT
ncbi:MAG: hypothetical protein H7836_16805, partial [Magnetococcus sp. YQC-3]